MDFGQLAEWVLPFAESVPALRAILAVILVFFLPGFAWTFVFFNRLSIIERIVLSIGLSIAIVTLSIIAFNVVLKMKITGANSLIIIIIITVVGVAAFLLKRYIIRRRKAPDGD